MKVAFGIVDALMDEIVGAFLESFLAFFLGIGEIVAIHFIAEESQDEIGDY